MRKPIPQGFWPPARDYFSDLEAMSTLPMIRGTWQFVDPTSGAAGNDGTTPTTATTWAAARARMVDGAGDGICLLSRGTGTSSQTTSYLTAEDLWTLSGVTVFGACAPTKSYQRARIANKTVVTTAALTVEAADLKTITRAAGSFLTDGWVAGMKFTCAGDQTTTHVVASVTALTLTATTNLVASAGGISSITSYNVNLMTISGTNNTFINVMFWNGGTDAKEIGGLVVSGARNAFINCHITGGAGAASAATKYSLKLSAAEEVAVYGGTIGSDTFDHGDHADSDILLSGQVARNYFEGVEVRARVSAGTAHGGVKSDTTTGGRGTEFKDCTFNFTTSVTVPAAVHIVSGAVDKILLKDCAVYNATGWGTDVWNNVIAPTAAAAGGIATTA